MYGKNVRGILLRGGGCNYSGLASGYRPIAHTRKIRKTP